MNAKLIAVVILSVALSALCIYLSMQRQSVEVILVTAVGAITGWVAVIHGGKLPRWWRDLWGDRINDDCDPANLPVRIWLPALLGGLIILGAIIVCFLRS